MVHFSTVIAASAVVASIAPAAFGAPLAARTETSIPVPGPADPVNDATVNPVLYKTLEQRFNPNASTVNSRMETFIPVAGTTDPFNDPTISPELMKALQQFIHSNANTLGLSKRQSESAAAASSGSGAASAGSSSSSSSSGSGFGNILGSLFQKALGKFKGSSSSVASAAEKGISSVEGAAGSAAEAGGLEDLLGLLILRDIDSREVEDHLEVIRRNEGPLTHAIAGGLAVGASSVLLNDILESIFSKFGGSKSAASATTTVAAPQATGTQVSSRSVDTRAEQSEALMAALQALQTVYGRELALNNLD